NPHTPGMALGLYFLGGDPAQVINAGGPRALDAVHLREGSLLQPRFPAPLGMRGLTMMRVLAALNGLVNVAGGDAPAAHSAYVIILLRGTAAGKPFLMSGGIGGGYGVSPFAGGAERRARPGRGQPGHAGGAGPAAALGRQHAAPRRRAPARDRRRRRARAPVRPGRAARGRRRGGRLRVGTGRTRAVRGGAAGR